MLGKTILSKNPRFKKFYINRKTKFLVFSSPYLIALPIAILIILFLPPSFNKYKIKKVGQDHIAAKHYYFYADLDDDKISEKLEFRQLQKNLFSLTVYRKGKTVDQWNFVGKYIKTKESFVTSIGKDSLKYIYFFSFNKNKIYLFCFNPLENKFLAKNKFVVEYNPIHSELDCDILKCIFYDSDRDGIKEFYFITDIGYSQKPRSIFRYDPSNNNIETCCENYAALISPMATDTTNNHLGIYFATNAVGNTNDTTLPYSDMYAWLMRFGEDANLKYKPVKIGYYPSLSSITTLRQNGKNYFITLNIYHGVNNHLCSINLFDSKLDLLKTKKFPYNLKWDGSSVFNPNNKSNTFYVLKTNGEIDRLDYDLNLINK